MDEFEQINAGISRLREKAACLPMQPGVYLMKNADRKIIYIGKAKLLKNRVNQYFHSFSNLTPKTVKLVSNISDFDYIVVSSEYEALLLELTLIKKFSPKYNILLKDDKGTSYIKITPPPWSRILPAYRIENDGSEYIGPMLSSYAVKLAAEQVNEIFALPSCGRSFGKNSGARPCLNYYIKKCYAPCKKENCDEAYHASLIAEARKFLREGSRSVVKRLTEQMREASEKLDFEKAAQLRDRINAVKRLEAEQVATNTAVRDADIFALARGSVRSCFTVITVRDHKIANKSDYFIDDTVPGEAAAQSLRSEFLIGYYANRADIPAEICLDGKCDDPDLLSMMLEKKRGSKVRIAVPQRGDSAKLVEMCSKNAFERLTLDEGRRKESGMLAELAKLTAIELPRRIESYDISNTAGADAVAGMVIFTDGRPQPSLYRRFNLRNPNGSDDCASISEAVSRRYARFLDPETEDPSFKAKPDLILVDGALGQVNAVCSALEELGIGGITVFGMVKDSRHRTRALIDRDGNETELRSSRGAFTLVSAVQEEVHRYSVTCHRGLRSRRAVVSVLAGIPGIGPKRIRALMDRFKTIDAISKASEEELASAGSMTKSSARNVKKFFEEEY